MPTSARLLRSEFEAILATFFPRWRAGARWRVRARTVTRADGEHGAADDATRTISIAPWVVREGGNLLALVLIHEISHAVVRFNVHGVTWRRRMEQARATALRLGRESLAGALAEELEKYDLPPQRAAAVYSEVADALLDGPTATFTQVRRAMAARIGVSDAELPSPPPRLRAGPPRSSGHGARPARW